MVQEPLFIDIIDFNKQSWSVNIKHIFQITQFENHNKEKITSVSYYSNPYPDNSDVYTLKTPENKESVLNRINHLKLN